MKNRPVISFYLSKERNNKQIKYKSNNTPTRGTDDEEKGNPIASPTDPLDEQGNGD